MVGPIPKAYSTVPTPTVPPRTHPTARTTTSMLVRTNRTDSPVRATNPVIRPSRGPGPMPAPMYRTLANPLRRTPVTSMRIRTGMESKSGKKASEVSTEMAMTTTLATVPNPGR